MNTPCARCGHTRLLHTERGCLERVVALEEVFDTWGLPVSSIRTATCDCPEFQEPEAVA